MSTSSGLVPAFNKPEMSASPILPAPMTAIMCSPSCRYGSKEKGQVRGPFREAPREVGVPLGAVRQIHPDLLTPASQPALLIRPDAEQHLVLVFALVAT